MQYEMNTRYNPILESVITYTEELAQKQAEEADDLLSKGVYLGRYLFQSCQYFKFMIYLFIKQFVKQFILKDQCQLMHQELSLAS